MTGSAFAGPAGELVARALDHLPGTSVTVFDRGMTIVLARGDGYDDIGIDPADLEGRPASQVLSADRWRLYESAGRAALAGEETTVQVDSPDRSHRILVRFGPVRDAAGDVVGGVAVAADVSHEYAQFRRLAEAEERVRLVLTHTADAIVQYARDGTVLWVTPAFERLFGYREDEVVGTRPPLTPDGQPDDVAAAVLTAIRAGRDRATVRTQLQTRDRRTVWCDVTTTIVWTPSRTVDFTVSVFHDASALVAAADTSEAALGRYRLLAENAYDAVLQVDSAGRIAWASPSVAAVVGRTAESLVGWRIVDLILAEDLRRLGGLRDAAGSTGGTASLSARIRRPDGTTMWVRVRERAIRPDGLVVTGHVITLTNVDEEVAARAALAEAEGLLQAATHGPGVSTSVVGRDGRFISVNAAWSEYTGRSEMEASGLTLWDLMEPGDVAEDRARFADLLAGQHDFYRVRVSTVRPDGVSRLGHVTRSAVRGPDGAVRFVLSQTRVPKIMST